MKRAISSFILPNNIGLYQRNSQNITHTTETKKGQNKRILPLIYEYYNPVTKFSGRRA